MAHKDEWTTNIKLENLKECKPRTILLNWNVYKLCHLDNKQWCLAFQCYNEQTNGFVTTCHTYLKGNRLVKGSMAYYFLRVILENVLGIAMINDQQ